jgi:hypothetical membrane protein
VARGDIWILHTLQSVIAHVIVASAWHHPPFSWLSNYISDLGNNAGLPASRSGAQPEMGNQT